MSPCDAWDWNESRGWTVNQKRSLLLVVLNWTWGDFISLYCLWRETGEISSSWAFGWFLQSPPSLMSLEKPQSPTKTHHRFILALMGLVYMEALKRVALEELKLGLEWVPFQKDTRESKKFHCTQSLFIFACCTMGLGLGEVPVLQGNPSRLLLQGKLHSAMTPFSPVICGVTQLAAFHGKKQVSNSN